MIFRFHLGRKRWLDSSLRFTAVGTSGLTAATASGNFPGLGSTQCCWSDDLRRDAAFRTREHDSLGVSRTSIAWHVLGGRFDCWKSQSLTGVAHHSGGSCRTAASYA